MYKCFIFLASILAVVLSAVVDITDNIEFEEKILSKVHSGEKAALVEFFAPWCGHCKQLAPEWKIAGDTFQPTDDIIIAAVDATQAGALAAQYDVKGYPTIKFFPKGSKEPIDYTGGRTADDIIEFVNKEVGTQRRVKKVASAVVDLTSTAAFEEHVKQPKNNVLVKFYAPWCGHCKSMAPDYEKVAAAFAGENNVIVAEVDVTKNQDLGKTYDVSGFPTLKFFPAGEDRSPVDYESSREADGMLEFLNEKTGAGRLISGELLPTAGRVEALDDVIQAHKSTGKQVDDPALGEAIAVVVADLMDESDRAKAERYITTAGKILAKGAAYVEKETLRLEGLLSKGHILATKRTNMMIRKNILAVFA